MKPQFEIHEGQLFLMLDNPVPLTPDAEMPCLVRLIQDDSPMGKYNRNMRKSPLDIIEMCVGINRQYQYIISNSALHYARYEIIGTPVAEGSKEWALYQMMQGEAVTFFDQPNRILRFVNGYIQDSISDGFWNRKSANDFLSYASSPGWQIYKEPKHLLADAKEGWLVTNRAGHTSTIKYVDNNKGVLKYAYEISDGTTIYVRENGMLNIINHNSNYDIVSAEPLAPEGSAEWAWQMYMLKLPVVHKDLLVSNPSMAAEDAAFFGDSYHYWSRNKEQWLESKPATGWQIYEEPESQYKVGDWVEYKKVKHYQVDSVHDGCCYLSYGKGCGCFSALNSDITRKLDPSEVVIRIGCLSGRVEPVSTNGIHIWFHLISVDDKIIATIRISSLDAHTRELVESLIKAQGEENAH